MTKLDLTDFFKTLSDAVDIFKAPTVIKGANCNGCLVRKGRSKRKRGVILFEFMAKGDNHVRLEIRLIDLLRDPETYIHNTLHDINKALEQMKHLGNPILLPPKKRLAWPNAQEADLIDSTRMS